MSAMDAVIAPSAWKVVGASVVGVSHQESGGICQDAFQWAALPDGAVIVAVADGAGSAARSEVGARLAVDEVVAFVTASLGSGVPAGEELLRGACGMARARLQKEAEESSSSMRDLACTLCAVLVTESACYQVSIGDSGAIVRAKDGRLLSLIAPQKGEYVNETCFLTGSTWAEDLGGATLAEPVEGVIAGSDGLMDFMIRGNEPVERYLLPFLGFIEEMEDPVAGAEELSAFLQSKNVTARVYDDVTLLLCWRAAVEAPA